MIREGIEYDGQAPAKMTLENGDTAHAEFAASNLKRLALSMAQLADQGIEVKVAPSATSLITNKQSGQRDEMGSCSSCRRNWSRRVEGEEEFERAMNPSRKHECHQEGRSYDQKS